MDERIRNFNTECYEPREFLSYQLHTLKNSISFDFFFFFNLKKSPYGFHVTNVKEIDSKCLTQVLKQINPSISMSCESMYIKDSIDTMYDRVDDDTSFDNKKWILSILITGYKVDQLQRASPMWKALHVAEV